MNRTVTRLAIAVALVGAAHSPGTAGVLIVTTEKSQGPGDAGETARIHLDQQAARIETDDAVIIYRKDLDTAWMIQGGSYMELDKKTARAMGGQMAAEEARLQNAMKRAMDRVPAENRAMLEQMMKDGAIMPPPVAAVGLPPAAGKKPTFRAGARGQSVGQWSCDEYEGYVDAALVEKVCAADPATLGVAPGELDVMRDAGAFFRDLSGHFAKAVALTLPPRSEAEQGYPGFPVRRWQYQNGVVTGESAVREVTHKDFDPSLFARPSLPKKDFPVGAGAPPATP